MQKNKKRFTLFGKTIIAIVAIVIVAITVIAAGHPIKTYGTMQEVAQDGGHWAVSDTKKTIDDLPAIEWKKN